jgi:cyanosortase A-associated protein
VVVSDQSAFDFWHGSEGNQIFSLIAFTIWIIIAHFIYEHYENQVKYQPQKKNASHQLSQSQKSSSTVSSQSESSPIPFLSAVGIIMTLITLGTFFFPQIGRRQVQPLNFPSQLSLNGWKREKSSPIVEEKDPVNKYIQKFRSGQRYQYRQNGTPVTVELRHIGGTFGNVGNFISTYRDLGDAYQGGKEHSLDGIGRYKLFSDQTHAYLSACITSQGKSTIGLSGFVRKMNRNLLKLNPRLLSGMIGKQSLRERNCLWVNLSTPLETDSPEKSYSLLESVFKKGYPKWQELFR